MVNKYNMMNEEIVAKIKEIWEQNPFSYHCILNRPENKELLDYIFNNTPLLDDPDFKYSLSTRIYWIIHNITDFPTCAREGCSNKIGIHQNLNSHRGYRRYCSQSCGTLDPVTQEKVRQSNLQKYGVESTNALKSVQDKKRKSIADHLGGGDITKARKIIMEKVSKTYFEHTGFTNSFLNPEVIEKRKQSSLKKYGTETPIALKEIRELGREKRIERLNSEESKKSRKAAFERNHPTPESKHLLSLKANTTKLANRFSALLDSSLTIEPRFTKDDLKLHDYLTEYDWHCKVCNSDFKASIHSNYLNGHKEYARCPICHPIVINGTSSDEIELGDYIRSLNLEIITNDRKAIIPQELDIYIPEKQVAIEYDGLFWHSIENKPDILYHIKKTELCETKGIKLIHIFEDEWFNNKELVKSRIKSILGIFNERIYARKCFIRELTKLETAAFFNDNHLQGNTGCKIALGLFYNNELVSAMSFGKSRYNKTDCWELIRFANKTGVQVIGGASRLLNHFSKEHLGETIISYADRRWSNGSVYYAMGFTLDHISAPAYWYIAPKTLERFNRMKFQKHKLQSILPNFDPALSEWENMQKANYTKIYDCGNLVFKKIM